MKNVTLTSGIYSVVLPAPQWGYETIIDMNMNLDVSPEGKPKYFDYTSQHDKRKCKVSFYLTSSQSTAIYSFLQNESVRCSDITMTMDSGSGFYPFGSDKYSLTYDIRVLNHSRPGKLLRPHMRFPFEIEMLMVDTGTLLTIPAGRKQGNLTIGTANNLPFPKTPSENEFVYNSISEITLGGNAYSMDKGLVNDSDTGYWTSSLSLELNVYNMSKLLSCLVGFSRSQNISIDCPKGFFMFGTEKSNSDGSGKYIVKQMIKKLNVAHSVYNRQKIELKFLLISKAG